MKALVAAAVAGSLFAAGTAHAELRATIVSPEIGALIRNQLRVDVEARSDATVTATATVDQVTLPLEGPACGTSSCDHYSAWFDLTSATEGEKVVVFDIADSAGEHLQLRVRIVHDKPAMPTLTAPLSGTVTAGSLIVRGTCVDSGRPCAKLDIFVSGVGSDDGRLVTRENVTSFDETVDVSRWLGRELTLWVSGHEPVLESGTSSKAALVYVENSPMLHRLDDVGGPIHDADLGRILWGDATGAQYRDRRSGQDRLLDDRPIDRGWLTSNGAVWWDARYEQHAVLILAAGAVSARPGWLPSVAGRYAAWNSMAYDDATTYWRDLEAGTELVIPGAGHELAAANGVLHYVRWTPPYALIRRDADGEVVLGTGVLPVVTDGTLVAVQSMEAGCTLDLHGPAGFVEPLIDRSLCRYGNGFPVMRNGWVAWEQPIDTPDNYQVRTLWVRAPDGTRAQLAGPFRGLWIEDISPDGEVIYGAYGRWRASIGVPAVRIGESLGNAMWRDGHWLVRIGRSLFSVGELPGGGVPDAGVPDAGAPDAGAPDAGVPDAGAPDTGAPDASAPDTGLLDAAPTDGAATAPGESGGCTTSSPASPCLGLAAALLLHRRHRRRARGSAHSS